ncbi:hypothetical protein FVE85_9210 [Porphyridium purpureum]|uniref:Ribosome biogenesis protein NOP53 n=1 Tax=Porphyridium purpureum TaxID=35688 RepID=A0A5J4YNR7_PORPP|nr:hypothetical protein FVE85_9210 [Porphyridium purpureum]|eukprot:POR5304..scf222_8
MGRSGKERKRKQRGDALASEIADRVSAADAAVRTLGASAAAEGAEPDEALFVLDATPQSEEALRQGIASSTREQLRLAKKSKARRGEQALNPNPHTVPVQPPTLRRKAKSQRKRVSGQALVSGPKPQVNSALVDLWGESVGNSAELEAVPASSARKRGSVGWEADTNTLFSADPEVLDGLSVNPEHRAHQHRLAEAVADAYFKEERERILKDRLSVKHHVADEIGVDNITGMVVAASPAAEEHSDGSSSDDGHGNTGSRVRAPLTARVKTRAERNKQRRAKENRRAEVSAGIEKRKNKDIGRAKEIVHKLVESDAARQNVLRDRTRAHTRSRLFAGRVIARREVDVLLTDELTPHLRTVKYAGSGSLMKESFLRMQEKRMIVPRR